MGKTKTFGRSKKSLRRTPKLRLKKGVKIQRHNPFKTLLNEKLIAQAFWECLKDNDPDGAMEVLNAHLNALNKVVLAKDAEVSRTTIYNSFKNKNPTLRTVAKMIHCSI